MGTPDNWLHSLSADEEDLLFELRDRLWVQYATFESFVQNHDGVPILPSELKQEMNAISERLHSIYVAISGPFDESGSND